MKLGHCVTNPGTREPTVLASGYATLHDISGGRMVMGIGRGDSARPLDRPAAGEGGRVRAPLAMIKDFMNGREVRVERQGARAHVGAAGAAEIPMWVAGYGPKALAVAGRVGDGVIIQLADPEIIQWIMDTARACRRGGGPRPGRAQVHRLRAEPHLRRHRGRARAGALVPGDGLEPRHGPHRALRLRVGDPAGADRVRQGAQVLRLQGALAASARSTASSSPTRSATASASSAPPSRRPRS